MDAELATVCIDYLNYDRLSAGRCGAPSDLDRLDDLRRRKILCVTQLIGGHNTLTHAYPSDDVADDRANSRRGRLTKATRR